MNFYSDNLSAKKYLAIINKFKDIFSKKFILQNPGSLTGDKSIYRIFMLHNLIKKVEKVNGDVIEFGIWNGNNLFTIKKILDFYKLKKKLFGYDNFSGFPNPVGYNKKNINKGVYTGNPNLIKYIIKFFNFNKVYIINDDIMNLQEHLNKFNKISFIYIDCNIYQPVKNILDNLDKKLSKGGIIAFDEALKNKLSGEGKALNEFYKKNRKKYKIVKLKKNYQPDIYLIKN